MKAKHSILVILIVLVIGIAYNNFHIDFEKWAEKIQKLKSERSKFLSSFKESKKDDNDDRLPLSVRLAIMKLKIKGGYHSYVKDAQCHNDYVTGEMSCRYKGEILYVSKI
jgi:hypothetical protein